MDRRKRIVTGIIILLVIIAVVVSCVLFAGRKHKEKEPEENTEYVTDDDTTIDVTTHDDAAESKETTTVPETTGGKHNGTKETTSVEYSAVFKMVNSWEENGMKCYQFAGTVTNNSSGTIPSWKVTYDVGNGASLGSFWNGSCTISGSTLIITPAEYNGIIEAGLSVNDVGFIIKTSKKLGDFTYNGETASTGGDTGDGGNKNDDSQKNTEPETDPAPPKPTEPEYTPPKPDGKSPFATHGKLSVSGTNLVDKNGSKFQLKGVSTHGLQWFPQYVNENTFKTLRDNWGANVVRLAMYTGEGGYCSGGNKTNIENTISTGVDAATKLGMYVIIDWHILSDGNPNTYINDAKTFFGKISKKYAKNGNVIYEICNEPNGGTSWEDIKKYADTIIPVIRANDKDAIILVGTPTWSQNVDQVAANPVANKKNVMYTLHFYAGTHKDDLRNKLKNAINSGTPVFISEFSICDASGNGGIDKNSAEAWKSLIKSYNLSYCGWSLCNKNETSALIKPGCDKLSGWSTDELSETGKWLRNLISGK